MGFVQQLLLLCCLVALASALPPLSRAQRVSDDAPAGSAIKRVERAEAPEAAKKAAKKAARAARVIKKMLLWSDYIQRVPSKDEVERMLTHLLRQELMKEMGLKTERSAPRRPYLVPLKVSDRFHGPFNGNFHGHYIH